MDQGVETIDGVVLSWYPFDAGLPMAAELVAGGGATSLAGRSTGTVVERLAWVPRRRLVLGVGDRVVKLDADPERVALGVDTLRPVAVRLRRRRSRGHRPRRCRRRVRPAASSRPRRRANRCDGLGGRRSTDRSGIAGRRPAGAPDARLGVAGRGLRPVMALVAFARPDLADRIEAIRTKLGSTMPVAGPLLPAHGDFNVSQLLIGPDGTIGLVDTDTLALAPVGFDLASLYRESSWLGAGRSRRRRRCARSAPVAAGDRCGSRLAPRRVPPTPPRPPHSAVQTPMERANRSAAPRRRVVIARLA
ncbi:MAG: phosphotransferase [Acidimicrobiales bacterium]